MRVLGAQTPFEFPGLGDAGRKLIAFGESADTLSKTLRRIGDVSAGIHAPVNRIAELYGKARVRGRLFTEDINQRTGRGMPTIGELAAMMGTFQFFVEGWDDAPEEVYAIPEIRRFYAYFHKEWPYWFYFCDLRTETLKMMTLCLLPTLSAFKRLGEPKAAVQCELIELLRFIRKNFAPLNLMMERAGMSETDTYNRTRDLFLYFDLPYDVEPPG